jgi:hypothetical protein
MRIVDASSGTLLEPAIRAHSVRTFRSALWHFAHAECVGRATSQIRCAPLGASRFV